MDFIVDSLADEIFGEEGFLVVGEFAEILLAEPAVAHRKAVALEDFGTDAGAISGRDLQAMPIRTAFGPGLMEKAATSEVSAHEQRSPSLAARTGHMMRSNEYVEVRNGGYYVSATRIGLDVVIHNLRNGRSAEAIFDRYHLHPEASDGIEDYLKDQDRILDKFKTEHPMPADMIERFERAKDEMCRKLA